MTTRTTRTTCKNCGKRTREVFVPLLDAYFCSYECKREYVELRREAPRNADAESRYWNISGDDTYDDYFTELCNRPD